MAIPLATTTITVTGLRPDRDTDILLAGYPGSSAEAAPVTVTTGHRACISLPKASTSNRPSGNDGATLDIRSLLCDPMDLRENDTVLDEQSGVSYEVTDVTTSDTDDFGLEHVKAKLRKVIGGVP